MQLTNIKFITAFNELKNIAGKNSPDFSDKLCEFLVEEFQFQSVIIFKINENNKLVCLGKSSTAKKSFLVNSTYDCRECKLLKSEFINYQFNTESNCEIQSTDYLIYEGCFSLKAHSGEKFLLKVSQKTPFTQTDKNNFETIGKLICYLLDSWIGHLSTSNFSLNRIISEISDDLRTSLNSILGFTSLISEEKLSSNQSNYVSNLKDNIQKYSLLVNDLIEISKIEIGMQPLHSNNITLKSFFDETVKSFSEKIDKSKYSIETSIEKSTNDRQKLDSEKLKIILNYLLLYNVNLSESAKIFINVSSTSQSKINIRITNFDAYLSTTKLKDFFHPTFISESKLVKSSSNSMLSLILAKKYIEILGGEIDVSSASGKGTIINFTIKTDEVSPIEAQIISLPKAQKNTRTLVIEDDYATSKLLSNYLNKWGYEPTIVNSGEKALQIIQKENFLAIIMDIVLPDINGLELLKKIRENKSTKNTPVIICSVEAEQQKAFLMGAVEYFVKPIKYKDLVEVLTSYKLKKDSNVLCVDDDLPTLNLVKEAIESVGYNAVTENVSTKVLGLIENITLDLAIVDLDMPELNGFELIKQIKSNKKFSNLPIIIYTGKENFEEDLRKIDGLFTELLDKRSTKIEDLADTINAMINRYDEPTAPSEAAQQIDVPKILLVEDYKHSQIIVTRLLKKNNFTSIVVSENGAEALEQVKIQSFDLILMDMQMPVMNGFEATERIRQIPSYKSIPIIALTAFAMKGDREKCLEAGATDYIPKPIDSQEFIEKVKYYTSNFSSN